MSNNLSRARFAVESIHGWDRIVVNGGHPCRLATGREEPMQRQDEASSARLAVESFHGWRRIVIDGGHACRLAR